MQKTILVIEDDVALRSALCTKLGKEGFSVLEAANGEEGLKVAGEQKPDLILLDIIMPVMDGMTFLKKFRETPKRKDVPIIMLSNLSDEKKVQESMEHGVSDYLVKSDWSLEDVMAKVRSKLES